MGAPEKLEQSPPWSREEFEQNLRAKGRKYHIYHPYQVAMNSGKLVRPATVQLLQTSQRLTSGEETGYGLGWDLENVTLGGKQTQVVGHDGESLGGQVMSLMTFRERGIVVVVMSNISYADTFSLGLKVADAFARGAKSPAHK